MDIIDLALAEDIGSGDVTVRYFTDPLVRNTARIISKQPGVLAGVDVAGEVFRRVDKSMEISIGRQDGAALSVGDEVLRVSGLKASILTGERTALNFLQRLSGVATLTRRYVEAIEGTGCRLLDTRKTTPGFRFMEKAAVRAGGGTNHRFGLHDMVMVKDNHLAAAWDPQRLREGVAEANASGLRVEIEVDTLDQLAEVFQIPGVDVVLLDNMTLPQLRDAVAMRPDGVMLEASGGVNLGTIRDIAGTGVDFVSVGALTNSAPSLDLSLEIVE